VLSKRHGRWTAAQRAVGGVDLNGLAAILSRAAFDVEQLHHDPGTRTSRGADRAALGADRSVRSVPSARGPGSGGRRDPAGWLAELRTARREALAVYRGRVTEVAATIDATATELEAVPSCS
jgi:hypothetical protein